MVNKACRLTVRMSLQACIRNKVLKRWKQNPVSSWKRDLNNQKTVMAPLDKEGKMQTSRRAVENTVHEFYTELFRLPLHVNRPKVLDTCHWRPPPILELEFEKTMELRKRTALGLDKILVKLRRAGSTAIHSVLDKLFSNYLTIGVILDKWKGEKIIVLFKKGQRVSGNSLLTTGQSVYARLYATRPQKYYWTAWNESCTIIN